MPDKALTPEQINKLDSIRAVSVEPTSFQEADNSVEIVFSAGAQVRKYDYRAQTIYIEDLPMSGMILDDLNTGAPCLRSHGLETGTLGDVLGHVVPGSAKIVGQEARARVSLSKEPSDAEVVNKIKDGHIRRWSYGYEKLGGYTVSYDEATGLEIRTWAQHRPFEVSAVPVPADSGTNTRGMEPEVAAEGTRVAQTSGKEKIMAEKNAPENTTAAPVDLDNIRAMAVRDERDRQNGIRSAGRKLGVAEADVEALCADEMINLNDARAKLIDMAAAHDAATPTHTQHVETSYVGELRNASDTRAKAIVEGMEYRFGVRKDLSVGSEFRGASLLDLASACLEIRGVRVKGLPRGQIAEMAMRAPAAHTSADFPLLLANTANAKLQASFANAEGYDWYKKVGTRIDFNDFNAQYYPGSTGVGVVPLVLEGGAYQGATQNEWRESFVPQKRGSEIRMTREMLTNDSLGAFDLEVVKFGEAMARTISSICLTAITSQTMGDGKALYHADHANLSTDGGVPTVDRIAELDTFLRTATDGNDAVVGLPAKFLVAPDSLRLGLEQLYSDRVLVTDPADAVTVAIAAENRLYIPGLAGTAYYMIAGDPSALVWGWLAEDGGPVVSQYVDYNTDSLIFHASGTMGACVLKHQRFAKNTGA